jgi:hypothetical protein
LFWSSTQTSKSSFEELPDLIRRGRWGEAFRDYRRMLDGLDLWVADQLRRTGKGTPEEALGNAQQHHAQLRTGLEQIADKHATRLPALFHPDTKTVASEKAAGRPAAETIPMNVYVWKDEKDGKFHIHDLTTPSRPHEHTVEGSPTTAMMNTFFEQIARYPEGEVRYTLPDGTTGVAPTTGKTKWYEWVGLRRARDRRGWPGLPQRRSQRPSDRVFRRRCARGRRRCRRAPRRHSAARHGHDSDGRARRGADRRLVRQPRRDEHFREGRERSGDPWQ